ncbi:hypothetical protein I5Q34_23305 [Streptomyces sp. AV19]|uniref:effector-associated constant component EACC1 n=1 Tax=Streptomyces sp. AV19 TaxID=2793068 RepID=UPI0018FEE422|nr:hypothetical protein [Streptomyces sp. AV19]MBH1937161.1 hypothetical protein [Streptomyces sp. AV19]MDG4533188.1 hypothetical protein [Streptomyces sp. AV19]
MAQGEDDIRHGVRVTAPGEVREEDLKSLETWLKDEPGLTDRVQIRRAPRQAEPGAAMGPQLDLLLEWLDSTATDVVVGLVTESVKEWLASRRALGDRTPPAFRARPDDERD